MYFNTFVFQEKEYPLNTVVQIKTDIYANQYIGYMYNYPIVQLVRVFVGNGDIIRYTYAVWNHSGKINYYITSKTPDEMIEYIVEVPVETKVHEEKTEYYKDSEIPDMQNAWIAFIALMFFGTFLRDRWALWVIGSIYFYQWRKNRLRKPINYKHGFNVEKKVREINERQA